MSNRDCSILATKIREAILNGHSFTLPALRVSDLKRILAFIEYG